MKVAAFVVLALATVQADSSPYTIGQVAHGYSRGIITGVDYGYGRVSGYGAIGNRGIYGHGGYYGKREAEADPEAYTIGQVAHGYGRGIITGVDYGYGRVSGYGAIGNRGFYGHGGYYGKREADPEAYTLGQIAYGLPVANAYATGHPHNVGVITGVGYGYGGYGKREADSEAYTLGQVANGLPSANAYATGHPHNVGVITGVDYGHGRVSGYGAIGNRGYAGYGGYHGSYYG